MQKTGHFRVSAPVLDSGQFMSTSDRKAFGERLRQGRVAASYTARDFAKAAGVTTRTLARWEKGENSPRKPREDQEELAEKTELLAKLLGCTVLWLDKGIEEEQSALPEVEEYLRTHGAGVRPVVAAWLRALPFEKMRQPHPTVKRLQKWHKLIDLALEDEAQDADGDKRG